MLLIQLLPIGHLEESLLADLAEGLKSAIGAGQVNCCILPTRLNAEFAFHPERQQYSSSEILARMCAAAAAASEIAPRRISAWRILGVAAVDLYIPVLTFVFGEAMVGGTCAVVSTHRLREEFYGLPEDPAVLRQRLVKEALHEFGHTLSLPHCDDYSCAMASSHSVERIDLKMDRFCGQCSTLLNSSKSAVGR